MAVFSMLEIKTKIGILEFANWRLLCVVLALLCTVYAVLLAKVKGKDICTALFSALNKLLPATGQQHNDNYGNYVFHVCPVVCIFPV